MATTPTPEEAARGILAIFEAKQLRAGEVLTAGHVNAQFIKNPRFRAADYKAGMAYAFQHGWLEDGPNVSIRLTGAGYAEL